VNFESLMTFRRVAETRSYTRASDVLYMSQPAVSKQVRQLERFFKAKLIRNVGRELHLTDAGKKVYDLACRFQDDLETIQEELRGRVRVTIVGNPTVLIHYLPSALRSFWSQYPDVDVRTISRMGSEIDEAVRSGVADLGIQTNHSIEHSLVSIPYRTNLTLIVCSPDHVAASHSPVTLEELATHRIALPKLGTEIRRQIDDLFGNSGIVLRNTYEVSTAEIRTAALDSLAIGVINAFAVEQDLASGQLLKLDIDGFHIPRTMHLLHRKDLSPMASALLGLLIEE
jgi:DNA-binding transcriptional LysR family regulator